MPLFLPLKVQHLRHCRAVSAAPRALPAVMPIKSLAGQSQAALRLGLFADCHILNCLIQAGWQTRGNGVLAGFSLFPLHLVREKAIKSRNKLFLQSFYVHLHFASLKIRQNHFF